MSQWRKRLGAAPEVNPHSTSPEDIHTAWENFLFYGDFPWPNHLDLRYAELGC